MKSTIYADETGNSGEHLLDPEQPIFALASNDFGAQEAAELLTHVAVQKGSEPKFSTLKKTAAGEARLAKLLSDPRLNKTRVMVDWMHKPYMVVTKMVDLVMETLYHNDGGDLYENAANVALSNMLFYCMPAFCGQQPTDRFLSAFARLIWKRSETEVSEFFSSAEAMANACTDDEIRGFLLIIGNRLRFSEWFDGIPKDSLNPAIPSAYRHMVLWGKRKDGRFEVIHDESKPIAAWLDVFHSMLAEEGEQPETIGYDDRKFDFPLKATSIKQGKSTDYPQLQIADICAGCVSHWLKCHLVGQKDSLALMIEATGCLEWVVGMVGPSKEIVKPVVGSPESRGRNPVDPIVEWLVKRGRIR